MAYRASRGLPAVPLSKALTTTAGRHVLDTRENMWAEGKDRRPAPSCTAGATRPTLPTTAPAGDVERAGSVSAPGTPIPATRSPPLGSRTSADALDLWIASPGHNAILTDTGTWASIGFTAIGIGLDSSPGPGRYGGRVYDVWFGAAPDPTGPPAIVGTPGADRIGGTAFADRVFAGAGSDVVAGGGRNDHLIGGPGGDTLAGGPGNDVLWGLAGDDRIDGGPANDRLLGHIGNDVLNGREGSDTLAAGPGADIVSGHLGKDFVAGGPAADTFVFSLPATAGIGAGRDVILDFEPGLDVILLGIDAQQQTPAIRASPSSGPPRSPPRPAPCATRMASSRATPTATACRTSRSESPAPSR